MANDRVIGTYSVKVNAVANNFQQVFKSLQDASSTAVKEIARDFTDAEKAAMEFDKKIDSLNRSLRRTANPNHLQTLIGLRAHYDQLPKSAEFKELAKEGGKGIATDIIKLRKQMVDAMLTELTRKLSGERHLATLGQVSSPLNQRLTDARDKSYQYLTKAKTLDEQGIYQEYTKYQQLLNSLIGRYRQEANPNLYKGKASGQLSIARVRKRMDILESHPDFQDIMYRHTPDASGTSLHVKEQNDILARQQQREAYILQLKKNSAVLERQMERDAEAAAKQQKDDLKHKQDYRRNLKWNSQILWDQMAEDEAKTKADANQKSAYQRRLRENSRRLEFQILDDAAAEREAQTQKEARLLSEYRQRQFSKYVNVMQRNDLYNVSDSDLLSEYNNREKMFQNKNRDAQMSKIYANPELYRRYMSAMDKQDERQAIVGRSLEDRGYILDRSTGRANAPHWGTKSANYTGPTSGYRSQAYLPDEYSKQYIEDFNRAKRYSEMLERIDKTKLKSPERVKILEAQLARRKAEMSYNQDELRSMGYTPNRQGFYDYQPGLERSSNRKLFLGAQMAYGVDDAVSQLSAYGLNGRGFAAALRGAGNNITAAIPFMGLSPQKAVPGIIGATFAMAGMSAIATYIADTEKAVKATDQLKSSIENVTDALKHKFELNFEVKHSSASSLETSIVKDREKLVFEEQQAKFLQDQAMMAEKDVNRTTKKKHMFSAVYNPWDYFLPNYDNQAATASRDELAKQANAAVQQRNLTRERIERLTKAEQERRSLENEVRYNKQEYEKTIAMKEAETGLPATPEFRQKAFSDYMSRVVALKPKNKELISSIIRDEEQNFFSELNSYDVYQAGKRKHDKDKEKSLSRSLEGQLDKEKAITNEYKTQAEEIEKMTGLSKDERSKLLSLNASAEERALYEYRKQQPFGHNTQSAMQLESFQNLDYRNKIIFNWEDPLRKQTDRQVAAINEVNRSILTLNPSSQVVSIS